MFPSILTLSLAIDLNSGTEDRISSGSNLVVTAPVA